MEDKAKPQSEKIGDILSKLDRVKEAQNQKPENLEIKQDTQPIEKNQTVSDDFEVEDPKEKEILHYEDVIRRTLALFDISYDDLIRMDGKSAYNKAIDLYPHLINEVQNAVCPPLVALHIANSMKPYMEFTSKYGTSFEDIKESLKEEIKKENEEVKKKPQVKNSQSEPAEISQASVFADIGSAVTQNKNKANNSNKEEGLGFLFAR
ncbi:MAG: hypothetical protein GY793_07770 [Proteobacteria bacterium]|nr:hypothetical protein [Pseudomonadota bacterium]